MSMKKQPMSRRDFLRVAGVAATGGILMACAPQATPAPAEEEPTKAPEATKEPEPTKAPDATAVPAKAESVELSYYFLAWGPMQDVQMVGDELSKMTQEKINATVKLVPMDWSAFNEKLQLALAAGEGIDLMFTCNWANNFYNNVSNGVLVDLGELLPQNAPNYWASIKPGIWDAARVKGVLYGAINQQIWAQVNGFDFRKDLIEKYQWDPNTLKTYAGVEKYWETIKKNEPDIYPSGWFSDTESPTWWATYYGLDSVSPVSFIKYSDENRQQVMVYDTPEFKEACETAYRWVGAGYLPSEPTKPEDFQTQMKAGMYSAVPSNWAKPGRAGEDKAKYGFDFVSVPMDEITPPWLSTGSIVPTMNGIAKTCKDTVRTAQLLELMNTDVAVYTMLCKGIENKHWVWVDKAMNLIGFPEGITSENSTYNPNTDWMFGNQFNAPYVDKTQAESKAWEETKALNDSAVVAVMMGYSFAVDPVQTEIAQVDPVAKELGQPLSQGLVDPAKITEYAQKMKEAGAEKIRDEAQNQIDEWLKGKM